MSMSDAIEDPVVNATPPGSAPSVVVFGLGGTIAMSATETGGAAVPALSADQLVRAVPAIAGTGINVDVVDFRRLPGASLSFNDMTALSTAIDERFAGGATGIVITQGTDTIEETSYFLDLHHRYPSPLVVTGAMRNATQAGADGPANLLAAIQTAASPHARGLGCLVVFADEIHAAARVRKTHSISGAAFASPNGGPLGLVVEGVPRILNRTSSSYPLPTPATQTSPRVGLIVVVLGDDGEVLHSVADRLDGLVVAGFGAGHVPETLVAPLAELAARRPVVLASRTGAGPVLSNTYGFPGSERDLQNRSLISAGFLDPYKARILLHRLLAIGANPDAITAAFAVAGGYADPSTWPWDTTAVC